MNFINVKKLSAKRRKGFSLMEIVMACALIIALSAGAFFGYSQAQQTRKMAQMTNDMEALATACVTYESTNINSLPPDALSDLVTGLTAEESVDNTAHDNFVTSKKAEDGTFLDPWGQEYQYDAAERTITCTPKDSDGQALDPVVRPF